MINWYFDKILLESFEHMGEGKTIYEALVNKFYYIQKEKLFFKAAFRTDEQNCLIQHDFELIFDFYSRRIESNTGQPVSEHLGFLLEMYCYGSIYMTVPIVMEYNAEYTGEKYREIARVMGVKGVDDMSVEEYRKAAIDAVQIHAGHNYLLNQFLSPYYNNRKDQYGGSFENRSRLILECYDAIREMVGKDYPILIKLTCCDFSEDGFRFEECRKLCAMLAERGIDAIEVSGNIHGKAEKMIGQEFDKHAITKNGYFIEYAKIIAEDQRIPIFVTGGYRDRKEMEDWLNSSQIAGFGMSQPLLSEPDLVSRWKQGDDKKARCVHCSKCRTPEGNYCTIFERKE